MTDIDDTIRGALSEEDARLLERLRADLPLPQQLMDSFRGQLAWVNVLGWMMGFVIFLLGLYCAWKLLTVSDVAIMLRWGVGVIVATIALQGVKLWSWMKLQKNAVVREVKRLELQVARLSGR